MYTWKAYGDSSIWNLSPEENPIGPADVRILSISDTQLIGTITGNNGTIYTVRMTGNFIYSGIPSTGAEVSGEYTRALIEKDGTVIIEESYSGAIYLGEYNFDRDMSYLTGDDIFEGSDTFDNSDGIQGLDGNDRYTGHGDDGDRDQFYGGNGTDASVYFGNYADYQVTLNHDFWDSRSNDQFVTGIQVRDSSYFRDGVDLLHSVEVLEFRDLDLRVGGSSIDSIMGTARIDLVYGFDGNDIVEAGYGFDTVYGGLGNDYIQGGFNGDRLYGEEGNDDLRGGNGLDLIVGGVGNDTIRGAKGTDTLTGGDGADVFIFEKELDGTINIDTITDFASGTDHIHLSATVFTALSGQVGQNIGLNQYITYNASAGVLSYDADGAGSGAAVAFAVLGAESRPTIGTDFWVVS